MTKSQSASLNTWTLTVVRLDSDTNGSVIIISFQMCGINRENIETTGCTTQRMYHNIA